MTNNTIKIRRNVYGEIIAGIVSKEFKKEADTFNSEAYKMWEEFRTMNPKAKMIVSKGNSKKKPNAEKKIRPSYDAMVEFIKTQPNSEERIKEMERIKNMTAIGGKSYSSVVNWFNNTFKNTEDYKLTFYGVTEETSKKENPIEETKKNIKLVANS